MRASMRADGTTFRLRCTSGSVETEDLDGREELTGVPHIDEVDVGDIADSATRGYENHLCHLEWLLLKNSVEQGEWGETCTLTNIDLPCQT